MRLNEIKSSFVVLFNVLNKRVRQAASASIKIFNFRIHFEILLNERITNIYAKFCGNVYYESYESISLDKTTLIA